MSFPALAKETVDALATEIGEWAEGKGFRDDWASAERLESIADVLERQDAGQILIVTADSTAASQSTTVSRELRRIADVLRANVLGTKLALMHSELSEALETLRDVGAEGVLNGDGNFMEELADCEIRIKDTAHMIGGGLGAVEVAKVKANNDRPHKHGRKL